MNRIDWNLLFRVSSRFIGFLGVLYLSYVLKTYLQTDWIGSIGSVGHYVMGLFFFFMLFASGKKYQSWNWLFLLGQFGIVATF